MERRRQEMVDLWCDQNAEKRMQQVSQNEQRAADLKALALEKEKLDLEKQIRQKKRIQKQQILRDELKRQISELRKTYVFN